MELNKWYLMSPEVTNYNKDRLRKHIRLMYNVNLLMNSNMFKVTEYHTNYYIDHRLSTISKYAPTAEIVTNDKINRWLKKEVYKIRNVVTGVEPIDLASMYPTSPQIKKHNKENNMHPILQNWLDKEVNEIQHLLTDRIAAIKSKNLVVKEIAKFNKTIELLTTDSYKPKVNTVFADIYTEAELAKIKEFEAVTSNEIKKVTEHATTQNLLLQECQTYEQKKEIFDKFIGGNNED